ncbi:hypothetical protein MnTg02_02777 [bacterium MnTg02]|nr:hypothetical protein MnTg02_02777 [bacterium MnTg02]
MLALTVDAFFRVVYVPPHAPFDGISAFSQRCLEREPPGIQNQHMLFHVTGRSDIEFFRNGGVAIFGDCQIFASVEHDFWLCVISPVNVLAFAVRILFCLEDVPAHAACHGVVALAQHGGKTVARLYGFFRLGGGFGPGGRLGHDLFRLRLDSGDRLRQRRVQLTRILGGEKQAAGIFSQAAQAFLFFFGDIETDHMSREVDAQLLKLGAEGARVGLARLHAIADKNDRCLVLGKFQFVGCSPHGLRQWRLALWFERIHDLENSFRPYGPNRINRLDVATVTLPAVAIGAHAKLDVLIPFGEQVLHGLAGDNDLRCALDLAPHAARRVENKHHFGLLCRLHRRGQRQKAR